MLAEFTRRPTSIRAMTKCFSGQLVYLVSGTRQSIVTGVIPVVGSIDRPDGRDAQYARRDTLDSPFMFVSQREGVVVEPRAQNRSVGYQSVIGEVEFRALLGDPHPPWSRARIPRLSIYVQPSRAGQANGCFGGSATPADQCTAGGSGRHRHAGIGHHAQPALGATRIDRRAHPRGVIKPRSSPGCRWHTLGTSSTPGDSPAVPDPGAALRQRTEAQLVVG